MEQIIKLILSASHTSSLTKRSIWKISKSPSPHHIPSTILIQPNTHIIHITHTKWFSNYNARGLSSQLISKHALHPCSFHMLEHMTIDKWTLSCNGDFLGMYLHVWGDPSNKNSYKSGPCCWLCLFLFSFFGRGGGVITWSHATWASPIV
jgi:hypothetical protein